MSPENQRKLRACFAKSTSPFTYVRGRLASGVCKQVLRKRLHVTWLCGFPKCHKWNCQRRCYMVLLVPQLHNIAICDNSCNTTSIERMLGDKPSNMIHMCFNSDNKGLFSVRSFPRKLARGCCKRGKSNIYTAKVSLKGMTKEKSEENQIYACFGMFWPVWQELRTNHEHSWTHPKYCEYPRKCHRECQMPCQNMPDR